MKVRPITNPKGKTRLYCNDLPNDEAALWQYDIENRRGGAVENRTDKPRKGAPTSGNKRSSSEQPSAEDYEDLHEIRDHLESVARLLNGRAGNLAALQSSSRWAALQDTPRMVSIGQRLADLEKSADKDIASSAKKLKDVFDNIVKSSKSNWNYPAGMVPPASSLPEIPEEDDDYGYSNFNSCSGGSYGGC